MPAQELFHVKMDSLLVGSEGGPLHCVLRSGEFEIVLALKLNNISVSHKETKVRKLTIVKPNC